MSRWKLALCMAALSSSGWLYADMVDWPDGASVAVSLTYDDALDSQLDNALPALRRHGFRATFYVTVGREPMRLRMDEWRRVAAEGHELGNHTIYHPCRASLPDREWVLPRHDLDAMTVAEMREEIIIANAFLTAVDGETRRTYGATCFDERAGGEYYFDAIRDDFIALRELDHGMAAGSRAKLAPGDGTPAEELIRFVRDNSRPGNLIVFVFHGIGGDHLAVAAEAHEQLLQFLADNADTYWVDTYRNIMEHALPQLRRVEASK